MENYVTILSYRSSEQAGVHLEMLENAGIPAEIVTAASGHQPAEANPVPKMGGEVLLQVPESRAKEAAAVLEENLDDMRGSSRPQGPPK